MTEFNIENLEKKIRKHVQVKVDFLKISFPFYQKRIMPKVRFNKYMRVYFNDMPRYIRYIEILDYGVKVEIDVEVRFYSRKIIGTVRYADKDRWIRDIDYDFDEFVQEQK